MLFTIQTVLRLFFLSLFLSGCAIYYRDNATNSEHIWGFGHLAINYPVPSRPVTGKQAVIMRASLYGAAIGIDERNFGFSLGFDQREKIMIYDPNTILSIRRPFNDNAFLFRFGSWPDESLTTSNNNPKKED